MKMSRRLTIIAIIIISLQLFACSSTTTSTTEVSSELNANDSEPSDAPKTPKDFKTPEEVVLAAFAAFENNDPELFKSYFYLSPDSDPAWEQISACNFSSAEVVLTSRKAEDVGPQFHYVDATENGQPIGEFLVRVTPRQIHIGKAFIHCSQ